MTDSENTTMNDMKPPALKTMSDSSPPLAKLGELAAADDPVLALCKCCDRRVG